jgi:hypothetical protein
MWKTLTATAAAAVLATGAVVATPKQAEARCYGCAVGAGVIGGLAAGAIIGSAIARPYPYYGYGYYGGPVYYGPRCWWKRQRVAGPYGYGWRRVRVCR